MEFPVFCKNRNFYSSKNANKKLRTVRSKKFHFSLAHSLTHSLTPFFTITYNNMLPNTPPSPVCVLFFEFAK
jgi:hypothetical protein